MEPTSLIDYPQTKAPHKPWPHKSWPHNAPTKVPHKVPPHIPTTTPASSVPMFASDGLSIEPTSLIDNPPSLLQTKAPHKPWPYKHNAPTKVPHKPPSHIPATSAPLFASDGLSMEPTSLQDNPPSLQPLKAPYKPWPHKPWPHNAPTKVPRKPSSHIPTTTTTPDSSIPLLALDELSIETSHSYSQSPVLPSNQIAKVLSSLAILLPPSPTMSPHVQFLPSTKSTLVHPANSQSPTAITSPSHLRVVSKSSTNSAELATSAQPVSLLTIDPNEVQSKRIAEDQDQLSIELQQSTQNPLIETSPKLSRQSMLRNNLHK